MMYGCLERRIHAASGTRSPSTYGALNRGPSVFVNRRNVDVGTGVTEDCRDDVLNFNVRDAKNTRQLLSKQTGDTPTIIRASEHNIVLG